MAGKSSAIFSVSVATSATGAADVDSNFMPDLTGLTFTGMATTTATVDAFQADELTHEEDHGRRTPGQDELAAIGIKNTTGSAKFGAAAGDFIRVMYPDSITVAHRFRSSKGADPTTHGYGKILGSSMGLYEPKNGGSLVESRTTSADAIGSPSDHFIIADGDEAGMQVGAPIRIRQNNSTLDEYAIITQIGANVGGNRTIKVHPKFSRQIMSGETVNLCYAFFPVVGASNAKLHDFHMLMDMGGQGTTATYRRLASLCRCSGFTLSNDNFGVGLEMRIRPACLLQDDDNANVVSSPEPPGALLQHRFGARVDMSENHKGSSAPFGIARSNLPNFDWNISVEFDVAPSTPDTRGVLQTDAMEINNATASVTITSEQDLNLQKMIAKDELRTIMFGMGPAGSGEGGCFALLNAGRADGAANPGGGDDSRIQQETTLRAVAEFDGCDLTGLTDSEKLLAQAPFMLILPVDVP